MLKVVGASWRQIRLSWWLLAGVAILGLVAVYCGGRPRVAADGNYAATVSWNPGSGFRCEYFGQNNSPDSIKKGVARAYYQSKMVDSGFAVLEIETQKGYPDYVQAYAAGYLEGSLTWQLIYWHWQNTVQKACADREEFCDTLRLALAKNTDAIRQRAARHHKTDPYWHQIKLFYDQLDGLMYGWLAGVRRSRNRQAEELTLIDFLWINIASDLRDLEKKFNSSRDFNPSKPSLALAFVKLLPDDITKFVLGHFSAGSYSGMLRVQKKYTFGYHRSGGADSPLAPGQVLLFTSYPGSLHSQDDLYLIASDKGKKSFLVGTAIENFNHSLWQRTDLLSQILVGPRILAANRLSVDGETWSSFAARENSGSANKQWLLLQPEKNQVRVWLTEMLPGIYKSKEVTQLVQEQGFWVSSNRPHFRELQAMSEMSELLDENLSVKSGTLAEAEHDGSTPIEPRFHHNPAADTLARGQANVTDLNSLIALLRSPDVSIVGRSDLLGVRDPLLFYSLLTSLEGRTSKSPKQASNLTNLHPTDATNLTSELNSTSAANLTSETVHSTSSANPIKEPPQPSNHSNKTLNSGNRPDPVHETLNPTDVPNLNDKTVLSSVADVTKKTPLTTHLPDSTSAADKNLDSSSTTNLPNTTSTASVANLVNTTLNPNGSANLTDEPLDSSRASNITNLTMDPKPVNLVHGTTDSTSAPNLPDSQNIQANGESERTSDLGQKDPAQNELDSEWTRVKRSSGSVTNPLDTGGTQEHTSNGGKTDHTTGPQPIGKSETVSQPGRNGGNLQDSEVLATTQSVDSVDSSTGSGAEAHVVDKNGDLSQVPSNPGNPKVEGKPDGISVQEMHPKARTDEDNSRGQTKTVEDVVYKNGDLSKVPSSSGTPKVVDTASGASNLEVQPETKADDDDSQGQRKTTMGVADKDDDLSKEPSTAGNPRVEDTPGFVSNAEIHHGTKADDSQGQRKSAEDVADKNSSLSNVPSSSGTAKVENTPSVVLNPEVHPVSRTDDDSQGQRKTAEDVADKNSSLSNVPSSSGTAKVENTPSVVLNPEVHPVSRTDDDSQGQRKTAKDMADKNGAESQPRSSGTTGVGVDEPPQSSSRENTQYENPDDDGDDVDDEVMRIDSDGDDSKDQSDRTVEVDLQFQVPGRFFYVTGGGLSLNGVGGAGIGEVENVELNVDYSGLIDTKVVSSDFELRVAAGPPFSDSGPGRVVEPFRWSTSFIRNSPHIGHVDTWDYDFEAPRWAWPVNFTQASS